MPLRRQHAAASAVDFACLFASAWHSAAAAFFKAADAAAVLIAMLASIPQRWQASAASAADADAAKQHAAFAADASPPPPCASAPRFRQHAAAFSRYVAATPRRLYLPRFAMAAPDMPPAAFLHTDYYGACHYYYATPCRYGFR